MTRPPVGNITVTTEVGYCPFCRRTRTLRREERHLGGLVRTNIDCESCHRALSSTLGPPTPAPVEAPAKPVPAVEPAAPAKPEPPPRAVRAPVATKTRKPTASTGKTAAKKPATRAGSTTKKK